MTLQRAMRPLLANAGCAFVVSIVGCGASHANANDNLQGGPEAQTPEGGGEMREGGAETSQVPMELTPPDDQFIRSQEPLDPTPDISASDYQAFLANTNAFGFDVFHQVAAANENFVYSPASVAVALGLAYA